MISLDILEIIPLTDVELMKLFSQYLGFRFVLLTMSFALQNRSSFMRSHLSILDLRECTIGIQFRIFHMASLGCMGVTQESLEEIALHSLVSFL